jgi:glycosyltransferase involved in cell wall biosynthesis
MMRVLYVATRICWPVRSGGHLRDFHLARYLSRKTKLTYIGLNAANGQQNQAVSREPIEPLGETEVIRIPRDSGYGPGKIVRGLLGPRPLVVLNYTSEAVMGQLQRVLSESRFDVVQIEGIFLNAYARRIRQLAPRSLLNSDWHNVESALLARYAQTEKGLARRLYAHRTVTLLRKQERQLLATAHAHTVCSEQDRLLLLKLGTNPRIKVIPNGVDVQAFGENSLPDSQNHTLLYVGSMDYHANIDAVLFFADEIWPEIHQRHPQLRFVIVGSNPVAPVRKLTERPGIEVTGSVDDLFPYYRQALASVVPLRIGGGTRLKILEAMAAGVPVISTSVGAEGLPVRHSSDILIADSPLATVEATTALVADFDLRCQLIEAGRKFVRPYDWNAIGDRLLGFYEAQLATGITK